VGFITPRSGVRSSPPPPLESILCGQCSIRPFSRQSHGRVADFRPLHSLYQPVTGTQLNFRLCFLCQYGACKISFQSAISSTIRFDSTPKEMQAHQVCVKGRSAESEGMDFDTGIEKFYFEHSVGDRHRLSDQLVTFAVRQLWRYLARQRRPFRTKYIYRR
jgi:hypothetical protein